MDCDQEEEVEVGEEEEEDSVGPMQQEHDKVANLRALLAQESCSKWAKRDGAVGGGLHSGTGNGSRNGGSHNGTSSAAAGQKHAPNGVQQHNHSPSPPAPAAAAPSPHPTAGATAEPSPGPSGPLDEWRLVHHTFQLPFPVAQG